MIGAIVGDIAGSIYEFDNIKSKDFELFDERCEITDDSIMTIAIAKAVMDSDTELSLRTNSALNLKSFGRMYPFPMGGYGLRFSEWIHSDSLEGYNSYGNGSAMRVSPAAYAAKSVSEAEKFAEITASVTHNHPEGIKGAMATAAAIRMALEGSGKDDIRNYMIENYYDVGSMSCDQIRRTYTFDSSCQGTVPQAFIAFYESESFEDAIRNGVSLGGDTDTLCAITGSIAEAYYGVPDDIRKKAESYLPNNLLEILHTFEEIYHAKKT